jgi:hypothetical protein
MRRILGLASVGAIVAACGGFKNAASTADGGSSDAAATDGGASDGPVGDAPFADGTSTLDSGASDAPSLDAPSSDGATGCVGEGGCPVEVLVGNLRQASVVLVDSNNVYFADQGTVDGTVYECPKSGCTTPTTLGPGYATGLGVDGAHVYWNDFTAGSVVACAIGGCGSVPTVIAPSQPYAEGVTFDGTNLYWSTQGSVVTCVAPGCATPTTLAPGQGAFPPLACETGVAYWGTTSSVVACPAAGCSQTPRKVAPGLAGSVAVAAGVAYFTVGNAVVSCPVTGCTTPRTIGSSSQPSGIGADGVDVYWLDSTDDVVYACPALGCSGGPTHFADQQASSPGAKVVLDSDYAYWSATTQVLRKHR